MLELVGRDIAHGKDWRGPIIGPPFFSSSSSSLAFYWHSQKVSGVSTLPHFFRQLLALVLRRIGALIPQGKDASSLEIFH
jgi:hypothetical protein